MSPRIERDVKRLTFTVTTSPKVTSVRMWKVARQPRWIAALILALAIAGGFAALGQWQLARSVDAGLVQEGATETPVALETIVEPQSPPHATTDGQLVEVTGSVVPGDFVVLSDRLNHGENGFWVVGHLSVNGAGLAVAFGWAPTEDDAAAAIDLLEAAASGPVHISGRHVISEAPQETDFENGEVNSLAIAMLVNTWTEVDPRGVYGGYVIPMTDPLGLGAGLEQIDAPAPTVEAQINWLNIFYAAEWAVFAVFAVFIWYRLVKDAWEREQEEADLLEEERRATPVN